MQRHAADRHINGDGCVNITDYGILLALFGQTSIGAELSWDAENRLIAHTPLAPAVGDQKTTFTYDYMGRRVQKQVFDWDLNDPNDGEDDAWATTPATHRKFLWYNWLMIAELDGADDSRVRTYTWGLDLGNVAQPPSAGAGPANGRSIESAGGIGGLLATRDEDASASFVHFYDGNGNVTQMIDRSDDSTAAHYEYDAYANNLLDLTDPNQSGPYADTNAFRFSTKYWDDETGFGYWGYRYYSAGMGRWLNRDPIEEAGGYNLNAFARNRVTSGIDPLGEEFLLPGAEGPFCRVRFEPWRPEPMPPDDMLYVPMPNVSEKIGSISATIKSCCTNGASVTVAAGIHITRTGVLRLIYEQETRYLKYFTGKYCDIDLKLARLLTGAINI